LQAVARLNQVRRQIEGAIKRPFREEVPGYVHGISPVRIKQIRREVNHAEPHLGLWYILRVSRGIALLLTCIALLPMTSRASSGSLLELRVDMEWMGDQRTVGQVFWGTG